MIPRDCNALDPTALVVGWCDVEKVFVLGGSLPTSGHNIWLAIVPTLRNPTSTATVEISIQATSTFSAAPPSPPLPSPADSIGNQDIPLRR